VTRYAQTNIQLHNQLREEGYAEADLVRVGAAYDLAICLFAGRFRGSGKPFVSHLVGTASVLGSLHQPIAVVAAGLLHAAYTQGEFGSGVAGISDAKRHAVREAIGAEIEELIALYTTLPWNRSSLPDLARDLEIRDAKERIVLVMRLANELDDHLDLGMLYRHDAARCRRAIDEYLHITIDIAQRLGFPGLAADLKRAFDETVSADVPPALRRHEAESFVVSPASHCPRPLVAFHGMLAGPLLTVARRLLGWRLGTWTHQHCVTRVAAAMGRRRIRPFVGRRP